MPVVKIEVVTADGTTVEVEVDRPVSGPAGPLLDEAVRRVRAALGEPGAAALTAESRPSHNIEESVSP